MPSLCVHRARVWGQENLCAGIATTPTLGPGLSATHTHTYTCMRTYICTHTLMRIRMHTLCSVHASYYNRVLISSLCLSFSILCMHNMEL